jgi:uncharacterized YccA/Bax inhibitor family protein
MALHEAGMTIKITRGSVFLMTKDACLRMSHGMATNPVLERADFDVATGTSGVMTMRGTVNKTAILLLLTIAAAAYTWSAVRGGYASAGMGYAMIGGIAGFVLAMITVFKQSWAPVTAPIYALCEGLLIGGISAMYEAKTQGITMQATMLTFGTFAGMLFLFQANILRATPIFMKVIIGATLGIFVTFLLGMILSLFHINLSIFGGGQIGLIFSLVVVVVAALNLIIDFEFIQQSADSGAAPKYMEWYGAFGLMVTLIWLYLSMLRLLSNLNGNNR